MWAASSLRSNGQIVQLSRKDFFFRSEDNIGRKCV